MNTEAAPQSAPAETMNEDEVRDYAYRLYVQNGHRNDLCSDNWREAKACIRSGIAKSDSHVRLSMNLPTGKN